MLQMTEGYAGASLLSIREALWPFYIGKANTRSFVLSIFISINLFFTKNKVYYSSP